jgi:threonine dehydrogenase-like Zn-dependent dehydrogenase
MEPHGAAASMAMGKRVKGNAARSTCRLRKQLLHSIHIHAAASLHVTAQPAKPPQGAAHRLALPCRLLQVLSPGDRIAVIGDGKLGLLIAQLLASQGHSVTHLGRHERKLGLVEGTTRQLVTESTAKELAEVGPRTTAKLDCRLGTTGSTVPPPDRMGLIVTFSAECHSCWESCFACGRVFTWFLFWMERWHAWRDCSRSQWCASELGRRCRLQGYP